MHRRVSGASVCMKVNQKRLHRHGENSFISFSFTAFYYTSSQDSGFFFFFRSFDKNWSKRNATRRWIVGTKMKSKVTHTHTEPTMKMNDEVSRLGPPPPTATAEYNLFSIVFRFLFSLNCNCECLFSSLSLRPFGNVEFALIFGATSVPCYWNVFWSKQKLTKN